jgi:hypothetical protein
LAAPGVKVKTWHLATPIPAKQTRRFDLPEARGTNTKKARKGQKWARRKSGNSRIVGMKIIGGQLNAARDQGPTWTKCASIRVNLPAGEQI